MDRPKEAIERMRSYANDGFCIGDIQASLKTILDWLEGKHVCEWPKELTRDAVERLYQRYKNPYPVKFDRPIPYDDELAAALYALMSIAPQRKKRVVNIWETGVGNLLAIPVEQTPNMNHWRKVAGPIEI